MKKCIMYLFVISFMFFINLLGMDFVKKDPFLVQDIWITPHYKDEPKEFEHMIKSCTITGLKEGVEIEDFLDLGDSTALDRYSLRIFPHASVSLDRGRRNILLIKTKRLVDNVGVTVSFRESSPESAQVEYLVIKYKNNSKAEGDIIEVFGLDQKKLIFKKLFKDEVLYYKTYSTVNREFIVFVFEKHLELYDLRSGKKVTEIKSDEKVNSCYIGINTAYLIFSANNKVKVLNNKDEIVLSKIFNRTVLGCVSLSRYVTFALSSKENEKKRFVLLFDLHKKDDRLLGLRLGSPRFHYGFGKGWEEFYFWVMNGEATGIGIFNLDPFKKLLSKNFNEKGDFKKKIKAFKVEEIGLGNLGREITIQFDNGTRERYRKFLK